jgi:hypothetical protein
MRMMLKAQLDIEAANLAINDGSIGTVFDRVFGTCRPELAWFLTENGLRTCYAIFDMRSPDMVPALAEPLFQGLGATVSIVPVMSQAELQSGLEAWGRMRDA